uniref:Uromodulin-like isoform X1 n=1 Tax=Pogona vitticeps TaxID=103695 RepID=A0ABM5EUT1_9SAUR
MTVTSWPLILALFLPAFESFSGQQMELKDEKEEAFLRPRRNPSGRCLPNPCFHQGACQVVDDNPSCVCKPGFTGPFCKELMVKLECEEEYMKMMVRKEAFELLKIPLALVHLKNRSCKASEAYEEGEGYWGAKLTSLNHTACGSDIKVNGSHVSYFNMIESDREIRGVITRSILLRVHFSCVYAYKGVVGLIHPLQTADTLVQFAVKEGDFTVTMMLYKSASYDEAYQQQPLVLLMTDILYVLLRLQGQAQVKYFFLSVDECWGTPTADPKDNTKHPLIMKGCPHDHTLTFLNAIGTSTTAKFSFQMFQFQNFTELFLHCQVHLCSPDSPEPCVKQCPSQRKTKREAVDAYKKIVSYGPIQFLSPSHLEMRDAKAQDSVWRLHLWILSAVVLAGLVASFVWIAVAKAMKK